MEFACCLSGFSPGYYGFVPSGERRVRGCEPPTFVVSGQSCTSSFLKYVMMEDKRKKRSPKVSLPQPPINPRKLSVLPASKSATFSLGLPQPPSPKNRGKYKRSIGAAGQPKEVIAAVIAPPKTTRFVFQLFSRDSCASQQEGSGFNSWPGPGSAWFFLVL